MLQKAALASCLLLLVALTANAQQPSLQLAGVEMRLGMTQEEVLKRVSERFVVQLLPNSTGTYFIRSRERNSDKEYEHYGSMSFTDGRLTSAQKDWYGNAGRSDYDLAEALYFVIADAGKRGEQAVSIKTTEHRQQGFSIDAVIIIFSKRQVVVRAFDSKGSKSVQVSEEIDARIPR